MAGQQDRNLPGRIVLITRPEFQQSHKHRVLPTGFLEQIVGFLELAICQGLLAFELLQGFAESRNVLANGWAALSWAFWISLADLRDSSRS